MNRPEEFKLERIEQNATQDMTPDTTYDMKQFDTMIHPSIRYRLGSSCPELVEGAAVLLVMMVGVQSV